MRLETGLVVGGVAALAGFIGVLAALIGWSRIGFQELNPDTTMRQLIPAVVLLALGVQTVFASFFLSMLGLHTSQRINVQASKSNNQ